jgi:hypothetical protein
VTRIVLSPLGGPAHRLRLGISIMNKTKIVMMVMCVALSAGCTVPTTGTNATGVQKSDGVSCSVIADCAGKCADGDNACIDACIAKGTPDAQAKAGALKKCIDANACADSACMQSKCSSEVNACAAQAPSSSGGAPATGSVPADLVGTWQDMTTLYEIKADGTLHRATNVTTGTCHTSGLEAGVANASGDSLTLSFTSGQILVCDKDNGQPYQPAQEEYTWSVETRDGVQGQYQALTLTKKNCNDGYCSYSYDRTK